MKKYLILTLCIVFVLSSCSSPKKDSILESDEEDETEVSVIPSYSLSENQYKMILPYKPSAARGAITNQVTNRVDMDELEEGLRRHSTAVYDPEKYLYEEGQYLKTEEIFDLIDRLNPTIEPLTPGEQKDKKKKEKKVKEHREKPRIFSHILEQNYLVKNGENGVDIAGVSIGISLKSVYRFQVEVGGPYYYEPISKKDMLAKGKEVAEEILKEIREKEPLKEVPVYFALFREEEQSSPVPGNFVSGSYVKKGGNAIGEWEGIKEDYVLFPSNEAKKDHNDTYQKFNTFSENIATYFPNYVGVAGTGFYVDDDLEKLTLNIPVEFYGKVEVVGFTQYIYGQVKEIFSNHYDLEVTIKSSDEVESLIFRKAGDKEPTVHIYH